jgi:hypothetical protein
VELNCEILLSLDVDSWLLLLGGVPQVLVLRLGGAEGRVAVRGCGQGSRRHGLRVRREHCWLHVRWQRVGSVCRQHWTGVRVVRGGRQRPESTIVHPTLNKFLLAATIIAYIK